MNSNLNNHIPNSSFYSIRAFSFAMIIGVIVGTYSSIFVATPILNYTNVNQKTILKNDKENN